MNWQAVSFDWNQVRAFLATVEEGSLSAAARALGVTQPTLSRQVAALEDDLGVILFERGTRAMTLTAPGLELVEHVRAMYRAANAISLTASGQAQDIAGAICIATTNTMATYHLPAVLEQLRVLAPDLHVNVTTSNELRNLIEREADIAIRHARPTQAELIAKLVRETTARLYASQAYYDQLEQPITAASLSRAKFIGFDTPERLAPHLNEAGLTLSRQNFPLSTESGTATMEMVRRGLGLGLLVDEDARLFRDLVCVAPDLVALPIPVWLVTHRELHTSRRIRLVFDLLADHLAALPHSPPLPPHT